MNNFNESQKAFINNQPKLGNKFVMNLQYEPLYEYISTNSGRQYIWDKYFDSIKMMLYNLVSKYIVSYDDLLGDSWIYFNKGLDKYNPFYNGNFFPLKNYILSYMYNTFRGNIQYGRIIEKREVLEKNINSNTSAKKDNFESNKINNETAILDEYNYKDDLIKILDKYPSHYKQAILLLLKGKKQREIALELDISQSRVAIMWRTIRAIINGARSNRNIAEPTWELYNFCHNYNNWN